MRSHRHKVLYCSCICNSENLEMSQDKPGHISVAVCAALKRREEGLSITGGSSLQESVEKASVWFATFI